jgi:hypothetical protein
LIRSSGFNRTHLGGFADKVGWEALSPNAALTLCASRKPLLAKSELRVGMLRGLRAANPPLGLVRLFCSRGCGSCTPLKPDPQHAWFACAEHKECALTNCSYDPRLPKRSTVHAMQIDFAGFAIDPQGSAAMGLTGTEPAVLASVRLGEAAALAAGCACAITVANPSEATPLVPGHRVVVRALVRAPPGAGPSLWADAFHFKTVAFGFRRGRRTVRF